VTQRKPHPCCPICGRAIERREGESPNNYHRRRYCCRRCEREGRSLSAVESHPPRYMPGWPVITDPGERLSGQCFAPYEVRVRPQPGRVDQPATVLARGSPLPATAAELMAMRRQRGH